MHKQLFHSHTCQGSCVGSVRVAWNTVLTLISLVSFFFYVATRKLKAAFVTHTHSGVLGRLLQETESSAAWRQLSELSVSRGAEDPGSQGRGQTSLLGGRTRESTQCRVTGKGATVWRSCLSSGPWTPTSSLPALGSGPPGLWLPSPPGKAFRPCAPQGPA